MAVESSVPLVFAIPLSRPVERVQLLVILRFDWLMCWGSRKVTAVRVVFPAGASSFRDPTRSGSELWMTGLIKLRVPMRKHIDASEAEHAVRIVRRLTQLACRWIDLMGQATKLSGGVS